MQWKKVWTETRELDYYVAHYNDLTFKILGVGGFVTVHRFWLDIEYRDETLTSLLFFKLKDAKEWAEAFVNEGAVITPVMLMPLYS